MKDCPVCYGKGRIGFTLDELKAMANYCGVSTNYDPGDKECPRCKGKGKVRSK